jgi:hypothetical protein
MGSVDEEPVSAPAFTGSNPGQKLATTLYGSPLSYDMKPGRGLPYSR